MQPGFRGMMTKIKRKFREKSIREIPDLESRGENPGSETTREKTEKKKQPDVDSYNGKTEVSPRRTYEIPSSQIDGRRVISSFQVSLNGAPEAHRFLCSQC